MTLSCPRIALLTGVSLVAVGLAAPANAATTISPGIGHIDTSDPVEDLLIICDLAPGDPTSPCEYGVEASGAGVVEAIVDDVASGRIEQIGSSISGDVDLHIVSDGKAAIVAHATASEADGLARANAVISDAIYQEGAGPAEITDPNVGTLTNAGSIDVVAKAAGETMTTVFESGSFVTTVTVGRSSAFAAGIRLTGGYNGMTVTNSGTINVDAITFDDGFAQAIGIAALASVFMDRRPDVILTINNMGDIVARESIDGGQTWRRGLAINVAGNPENFAPGLPNKAVINLLGGNIYGNIAIQQGDVINVQRAETAFDGIINPVCMGTSFAVDGGGGPCGVGTLFINDGGTLFFQDPRSATRSNMYDGPSYAFVDTLDMRAGPDGATGTIAFGLQPTNRGSQPAGTYTQLFANTAILDGTLEVRFSPTGRTSANSYFWDNVIDADSRTGTFDNCVIGGVYGRSVLLGKLTCIYDDSNNVDLSLARVAFDKVHGMGRNAITVGAYLERIHGSATTGVTANLLADLFLIDDERKYDQALSSLGGAGYANYLQSFVSLGLRHNDLADAATHCGGARLDCRGYQPIRIWGMVDDQRSGARGGVESGIAHYTSTVLGADIRVGSAAMVGFSAGKVGNGVRQSISSEAMEAEGFQVGGYAALDPGPYYARGVITLSRFEGSSARNLNLASLGGTFAGAMSGDPDVKMRTLGLHAGARIDVGHGLLVNLCEFGSRSCGAWRLYRRHRVWQQCRGTQGTGRQRIGCVRWCGREIVDPDRCIFDGSRFRLPPPSWRSAFECHRGIPQQQVGCVSDRVRCRRAGHVPRRIQPRREAWPSRAKNGLCGRIQREFGAPPRRLQRNPSAGTSVRATAKPCRRPLKFRCRFSLGACDFGIGMFMFIERMAPLVDGH